jgi:hypothetical protein
VPCCSKALDATGEEWISGNTIGVHNSADHGQNVHGEEAVGHGQPREHAGQREERCRLHGAVLGDRTVSSFLSKFWCPKEKDKRWGVLGLIGLRDRGAGVCRRVLSCAGVE